MTKRYLQEEMIRQFYGDKYPKSLEEMSVKELQEARSNIVEELVKRQEKDNG